MAVTDEQSQALRDYAEDLKREIIADYDSKGLRASGNFEETAEVEVKGSRSRGAAATLTLAGHTVFITNFESGQSGRGPGSRPPIDDIEAWVINKGLQPSNPSDTPLSVAFAVANKIAASGTDIFQGKRKGLDLLQIIEGTLTDNLAGISDAVLRDLLAATRITLDN